MKIVKRTENGVKIDVLLLIRFLLRKSWILILAALIGGAASFFAMKTLVKPTYKASISMYINNSTAEAQTSYITSGDLNASSALGNTYASIIKSNQLLNQVLEETGVTASLDGLRSSIDVSSGDGSAVLNISVTRRDPKEAAFLANTIGSLAPDMLTQIVEGSSVKMIDSALIPTKISSPNYRLTTIVSAFLVTFLVLILIVLREASRTGIYSEEDLQEWDVPVIGVIDSFDRSKKFKKNGTPVIALLKDTTPFYIREAYNMVRTNIMLSIAGKECKTILFTSSIKGEGKSITTINLAKTMAATGKKVILLDCDFRMSTIAQKLNVSNTPGITDMLTGSHPYKVLHLEDKYDFIPAGNISPNPSELLSSIEMDQMLATLKNNYDYIFIDTPPVGAVTDPLVLIPKVSGVVVVVRENIAQKPVLSRTMDALKMADAKIIGFCYNGRLMNRERLSKYYGYGYSNNHYGYAYEYGVTGETSEKSKSSKRKKQEA